MVVGDFTTAWEKNDFTGRQKDSESYTEMAQSNTDFVFGFSKGCSNLIPAQPDTS